MGNMAEPAERWIATDLPNIVARLDITHNVRALNHPYKGNEKTGKYSEMHVYYRKEMSGLKMGTQEAECNVAGSTFDHLYRLSFTSGHNIEVIF